MSESPRARPAAPARGPSALRSRLVTGLVLVLLAGFLVLEALPGQAAALRVGGVALLWWYAVLAPLLAWLATLLAALACRGPEARGGAGQSPTAGGSGLGLWLVPPLWLGVPALALAAGADGLWAGLLLATAPLPALGLGAAAPPADTEAGSLVTGVALLLVAGLLLWASLGLVGDLTERLGAPRWSGVVAAGVGGWALVAWPRAEAARGPLVALAALGLALPVAILGWHWGAGPVSAWREAAERPAFIFSPSSRGVVQGLDPARGRGRVSLLLEEEHRITPVTAGAVAVTSRDGAQQTERHRQLAAGQALTLRPGDRLDAVPGLVLRFEAGKRVPGAPASGPAWALGRQRGWVDRVGLAVTVLAGAAALLTGGARGRGRPGTATGALALTAAFGWGLGLAAYAAWGTPEVFLGGVAAGDLMDVPVLALGATAGARRLQGLLLLGALAAVLALSVALRERVAAAAPAAGAEIGRDLGLWSAVFGLAGLASLWPRDPWTLGLWGLGVAAATVAPILLAARRGLGGGARAAVGALGGAVFVALWLAGSLGAPAAGSAAALLLGHPAAAALPVAAAVVWIASRRAGSRPGR